MELTPFWPQLPWLQAFWTHLPSWSQIVGLLGFWFLVWLPIAAIMAIALGWRPGQPLFLAYKLPLLASLYLLLLPLLWGVKRLGGYTLADWGLGWHGAFWGNLILGLALAMLGLAIVFGLDSYWGWVVWHQDQRATLLRLLPTVLVLAFWISFTEELLFRGVLIRLLLHDHALGIVAILTSILFALAHLLWDRQQTPSQLVGLWLMGMVLVLARCVTQDLSLAIGLHGGWIWGLTSLAESKVISYSDRASTSPLIWWVGIDQQPLAGAAGIFCLWGTALALGIIAVF
ncbi:MAG: CPBP family intramembrane glutamic endopeptidase [Cyanobacteria bacterium P01_G01_bin.54]